jgi:hypothetical protein
LDNCHYHLDIVVTWSCYRLHNWPGPLGFACHRNYLPDYLVNAANENQKIKAPERSGKRFSSVLAGRFCQYVMTTLPASAFSGKKEMINGH